MEKSNLNIVTSCTKQTIKSIPNLKPSTEYAIEETKSNPVITAIQTVQDAYISLKEDLINSGIKLINTPRGEILVKGMIDENIENLNKLAEKCIEHMQNIHKMELANADKQGFLFF